MTEIAVLERKESELGKKESQCWVVGISVSDRLTLKAVRDGESAVITGGHHRVATPVGLVHAVEGDVLSVENPVGLQVRDPHLPGVVEDAASLDSHGARSCRGRRKSSP